MIIEFKYDGFVQVVKVFFGGIIKEVSLEMVFYVKVDDYVLVYVGVVISVVDEVEAW